MKGFGLTILRIVVGLVFVMHSYLALFRFTPAEQAAFMASLGLPAPVLMAWIVVIVQGLGGIMLIVGLWTRWAAVCNAVIILGALLKIHLAQGFFLKVMKTGTVGGFEFALLLLAATVALILTGGGALAATRDR